MDFSKTNPYEVLNLPFFHDASMLEKAFENTLQNIKQKQLSTKDHNVKVAQALEANKFFVYSLNFGSMAKKKMLRGKHPIMNRDIYDAAIKFQDSSVLYLGLYKELQLPNIIFKYCGDMEGIKSRHYYEKGIEITKSNLALESEVASLRQQIKNFKDLVKINMTESDAKLKEQKEMYEQQLLAKETEHKMKMNNWEHLRQTIMLKDRKEIERLNSLMNEMGYQENPPQCEPPQNPVNRVSAPVWNPPVEYYVIDSILPELQF